MTREKAEAMDKEEAASRDDKQSILIKNPRYHWPNAVVPYVISTAYTVSEKIIIRQAMADLQS